METLHMHTISYIFFIWAWHIARMVEKRLLAGTPEGKRPLERPKCRQVDNIRMDLGGIGWGGLDWSGLG
jgi:hypothetical protein